MKKRIFYTKNALKSFRFISLFCAIFLLTIEIWSFYNGALLSFKQGLQIDFHVIMGHCLNLLSTILFLVFFFFPQKFGLTAVIAFCYSFIIILYEPENYMGILMYFLGIAILFTRGFMNEYRKVKLTILSSVLLCLILTQLRFGLDQFLNYFLTELGGLLILFLFTYLIQTYYSNKLIYEDKKLNIASYPELNERDCLILQKIQQKIKYEIIAKEINIDIGTLKNRLHFVFNTMDTGDKRGFLSYYEDWELYYDLEKAQSEIQSKKISK